MKKQGNWREGGRECERAWGEKGEREKESEEEEEEERREME